jgi:hypothetical protein
MNKVQAIIGKTETELFLLYIFYVNRFYNFWI